MQELNIRFVTGPVTEDLALKHATTYFSYAKVSMFGGAEVVHDEVIFTDGAHTWHRYWLRGWHRVTNHSAKWIISGITGQEETVIDIDEIRPTAMVVDE